MAALATVQDYVTAARMLLQDKSVPYRYSDVDLLFALNTGLVEARKLRPDLFNLSGNCNEVDSYAVVDTTAVTFDAQYRMALVYYICGIAQLRDDESTQDTRAGGFLGMFRSSLITLS
jgi:hypothetical protein